MIFDITGISEIIVLCFNQMSPLDVMIYLLMFSMSLGNVVFLNMKVFDYFCINDLISKNEAASLMQNTDLTK